MKLTYFKIQNYRSITKAEFKNFSNVSILIGPNNEGKSNILQALHACLTLLRDGQYSPVRFQKEGTEAVRIRYDRESYDWDSDYPVGKQAKTPDGRSTFELSFSLSEEEQRAFYDTTGSRLNDILPIQLQFDSSVYAKFKVLKQGKGGTTLSKKVELISTFFSQNIDYVYIPAIRTAETSIGLINNFIRRELRKLERNPRYVEIQKEIATLQKPIVDSIVTRLTTNLREFLGPTFTGVTLSLQERTRPVSRSSEVLIDDGTRTTLERKGDGVKSLVAISLMTRALQTNDTIKDAILLIEEPESHLHPKAIHQLRDVLDTLKLDRQIIVTTHCPSLINRMDINSNIIVSENKARPAKSLEDLRNILGVRISDNLRHASLVIVVEGTDDAIALRALFSHRSSKLRESFSDGSIAFDAIGGASKLRYGLSQLQSSLCNYFVILDDDVEARRAFEEAKADSLTSSANTFFIKSIGLSEAELEDLYAEDLYAGYFQIKYSVDVKSTVFKSRKKWSARIREGMQRSGKSSANGEAWPEYEEMADKRAIADLVAISPANAILNVRESVLESAIKALELFLGTLTK